MLLLAGLLSIAIIALVLWDAFEVVVLPRRPTRKIRFTRGFYLLTWAIWLAVARRMRPGKRRESYLSYYGPLSLLFLVTAWALGLILGFGLLHWSLGSDLATPGERPGLGADIYLSGTTFFTLGFGDVVPRSPAERIAAVAEAGLGFGFLAVVIGYLPVIYQAFSRREVGIVMLDARAGSPPSSVELLNRHACTGQMQALSEFLKEWERWSADVLESHISYPSLIYFRSQHDNQSWITALTAILDTCALIISGFVKGPAWQARLTFAMARHAVVDLAQVVKVPPQTPAADRLPRDQLEQIRQALATAGAASDDHAGLELRLTELRLLYEPYLTALGRRLLVTLPSWLPPPNARANWQTSAWGVVSGGAIEADTGARQQDVH